MNFIVYKISNSINDKVYFGVTEQSLKKRWQQHKCNSSRKNYYLYNAIKKYGIDKFRIEIVIEAESRLEMFEIEKRLIRLHKSNDRKFGYNNSLGGEHSSTGRKLSEEKKQKISHYQKNRIRKPHSQEAKTNMSIAAKNRDMSKAVLASAAARKGKPSKNRVSVILNNETVYSSITEASRATGVSIQSIHHNITGKSRFTKKGIWKTYNQKS